MNNKAILIMPVVLLGIMIAPSAYASTIILNAVKPGLPILPMTVSDRSKDLVGNITFFINTTDGHYHLKGIVRNTLPERAEIPNLGIEFYDKATQRDLGGASSDINYTRVAPGGMQHFDIDTGYNITMAAKEWQYMYGDILS